MSDLGVHLSLLILALIQGITEFLPVSSSGHLAIGQMILDVGEGSLVEDVVLHAGTLVAVLIFYRKDLWDLAVGFIRGLEAAGLDARRYVFYLILGNVPAGIVGVFFKDRIELLFDSPIAVLMAMAATAIVLATTRGVNRRDQGLDARKALLIGLAQSVAILPGASRSGWTIAVGLMLGLSPVAAARFSFLLSIPAIAGATVLQLSDVEGLTTPVSALIPAFLVAAITGVFCLRWLVALVQRMALHRFSVYLVAVVIVGTIILLRQGS